MRLRLVFGLSVEAFSFPRSAYSRSHAPRGNELIGFTAAERLSGIPTRSVGTREREKRESERASRVQQKRGRVM